MPLYEVVKPWSHDVEKGHTFEVESLHPSLVAHVKLVSGSVKQLVKTAQQTKANKPSQPQAGPQAGLEGGADDAELTAEKLEELHTLALAEDALRFPDDEGEQEDENEGEDEPEELTAAQKRAKALEERKAKAAQGE